MTGLLFTSSGELQTRSESDGGVNTFSYNGLGMRLTKSDLMGSYAYWGNGAGLVKPARFLVLSLP